MAAVAAAAAVTRTPRVSATSALAAMAAVLRWRGAEAASAASAQAPLATRKKAAASDSAPMAPPGARPTAAATASDSGTDRGARAADRVPAGLTAAEKFDSNAGGARPEPGVGSVAVVVTNCFPTPTARSALSSSERNFSAAAASPSPASENVGRVRGGNEISDVLADGAAGVDAAGRKFSSARRSASTVAATAPATGGTRQSWTATLGPAPPSRAAVTSGAAAAGARRPPANVAVSNMDHFCPFLGSEKATSIRARVARVHWKACEFLYKRQARSNTFCACLLTLFCSSIALSSVT